MTAAIAALETRRIRRVLTLRDLLFYGIVVIQPTAPLDSFGVVANAIPIGRFAMAFTAVSYGRLENAYPTAGSACAYVGKELRLHLRFLTGWSLALDNQRDPTIGMFTVLVNFLSTATGYLVRPTDWSGLVGQPQTLRHPMDGHDRGKTSDCGRVRQRLLEGQEERQAVVSGRVRRLPGRRHALARPLDGLRCAHRC